MASQSPLFRLLTPFLRHPNPILRHTLPTTRTTTRTLTSTSSNLATAQATRGSEARVGGKKNQRIKKDPRIGLIRYHLQHPATPRPLRFSRLRSLRHWTIHRAWMLFRRKKMEAEEGELLRQYQSMQAACEELRLLDGPGEKDGGRLFRIAMEKKGIFRQGGVPIEYARAQTETPGKEPWNHDWTR